ncbi:hypothetical protein QJV46_gp38 [Serratia phage vB_SmaS_Opt-155]|uniref:Uncharacterized protein n=1 Tax=Serratia phage vB_SmaS_Opt-155 TaxID=2902690 RepID=A0AC61TRE4_9CAUD|nr:hypothetical protein QJV46_gp38 [Serratia phage vB_SmaS_Opt-155]UGO52742.1 hypothetical protein OPT155_38 [Serratia phage vB_SmaS_Opt-155]
MKTLNAKQVRDLAKESGVKQYWLKDRATLVAEIITAKGWEKETAQTVEFLMAGGTIKQCKEQATPTQTSSAESSAGKSSKEHSSGFSKKASTLIKWVEEYITNLADEGRLLREHLESGGHYPITEDTVIFGVTGLYNAIKTFGVDADRAFEIKTEETDAMARKITKTEKKPTRKAGTNGGRDKKPATESGLITLGDLCDKYGVEPRIARRKLRNAMAKPEAGWNFTEEESKEIITIITK